MPKVLYKSILSYGVTAVISRVSADHVQIGLAFCSPEDLVSGKWDRKVGEEIAARRLFATPIVIYSSRDDLSLIRKAVIIGALRNLSYVPQDIRNSFIGTLPEKDRTIWKKGVRKWKGKQKLQLAGKIED